MKKHDFPQRTGRRLLPFLLSLLCGSLAAETIWRDPFPAAADGSRVLTVTSENRESGKTVTFPLDTGKIAGRRLTLSAEVRTDIERSAASWLGAKLMISGKRKDSPFYSRTPLPQGKTDWHKVRFTVDIPHDLQNARLTLGIQRNKGTVQYRNVRIERNGDCILDLSRFANMGYADPVAGDRKGGWTDQGPEKDAAKFVYRNKAEWAGIPFSVLQPERNRGKSVLVFRSPYFRDGLEAAELNLDRAEISGKRLCLLHTLAYGRGDKVFGTVELTGKNGVVRTLSLQAGREAADWRNPHRLKNGYVASLWTTPAMGICGLYVSVLPLDPTLGELKKIVFRSSGENPVWLLLAATVTDRDCEFPKDETFVTEAGKEWKPIPVRRQGILAGSALDRSFLNPPHRAGEFGRVVAGKSGRLEFEKRPGVPVRFFASADGLDTFCGRGPVPPELTDKKQIREYVRQLRLHGYNMVRLHGVDFPLMRGIKEKGAYDKAFLDRLDYFIYLLRENGIYLNLDGMKSSIGYTPGNPYAKDARNYKLEIYTDPEVRKNWEWGLNLLLTHENPYTKTRLADDPVLAIVVGYNEQEFAFLRDYDFSALLPAWQAFLKRKYQTADALRKSWGTAAPADFDRIPPFRIADLRSPHGADLAEFLTETEREMTRWYRNVLRKTGYRGLVSNFNMNKQYRAMLSRSESDLVTMNSYHAHPSDYNQPGSSIMQTSSIADAGNQVRGIISAAIRGKPFVITEHGHAFWNRYRYEQAFVTGAYAALQGLDGLTAFAQPVSVQLTSYINPFNIRFDPVGRIQEFLTAFLFLRGDVREAEWQCRIPVSEKEIYTERLFDESPSSRQSRLALLTKFRMAPGPEQPLESREIRVPRAGSSGMILGGAFSSVGENPKGSSDLTETVRMLKASGVLKPGNRTNPEKEIYESSTGELYMDAPAHYMQIVTPRLEGICGEAGTTAKLPSLEVLAMSVRGNLALTGIDGEKTLADASRMVLVFATDARNSGMSFSDPDGCVLRNNGKAPVLVRTGTFKVKILCGTADTVRVYALRDDGSRLRELPFRRDGKWIELSVNTASFGAEVPLCFEIIK